MTTRYADLLMDTVSRLAEAEGPDQTWDAAAGVANRIGARALTCGAVMRDSRHVAWVRSSMDASFLEAFSDARLYEVDPIQAGAIAGRVAPRIDVAAALRTETDPRARDLYAMLLEHGFRHYLNHTWIEEASEQTFALACDAHPAELFGRGTERAFSAVSAILSMAMRSPGLVYAEDRAFDAPWSRLSDPERDVLCYLGQGLNSEQIADRLLRPQSEVSLLLDRACRRLGTQRPEQALSLVLVRGGLCL
ncbi:hypothetical protein GYB14_23645 [bacterium]|nr:hypothetical protein [bacterium]